MEDLFSPSASQARQVLQEQKRIGQRAPAPGDGLGDGPSDTDGFAGKLSVSVNRSRTAGETPGPASRQRRSRSSRPSRSSPCPPRASRRPHGTTWRRWSGRCEGESRHDRTGRHGQVTHA